MKFFSPFFLLTGGLALSFGLRANAQAGPPVVGSSPVVAARAPHSSQLSTETLATQQARPAALQAETEAAIRRANRAEVATVAFKQRLRQLEAAGNRPIFWR